MHVKDSGPVSRKPLSLPVVARTGLVDEREFNKHSVIRAL